MEGPRNTTRSIVKLIKKGNVESQGRAKNRIHSTNNNGLRMRLILANEEEIGQSIEKE